LRINIVGSTTFQNDTQAAINEIRRTPAGQQLYDNLNGSPNTHTITESTGGNSCNPATGYTPGTGAGSTTNFNPTNTTGGVDSTGSTTRPPYVGLAHEWGHAEGIDQGTQTFDRGTRAPGTTPPSEQNSMLRENQQRNGNNLPTRPSYY
jgi:hypothetical protein